MQNKTTQHKPRTLYAIKKSNKAVKNKKNFFLINFMAPFLWMRFNYLKATEPLRGGSLLFTTKFPEIPGTHFINLRRMKG